MNSIERRSTLDGDNAEPGVARPLHVTVMLGGPSSERSVSLRSGAAVVTALRSLGHHVNEMDPCDRGWTLPRGTDLVFLALHGTYGEDGTVQRQLEEIGVPYTGCDAEASRIAFDKVLTKERCHLAGVATARYEVFHSPDAVFPAGWKPPVVLKPVCQGSSVGLQFVDRLEDWPAALEISFQFDKQVLMEERIIGRETTVGVLAGEALPVVEVRPRQGPYNFENKYTQGATEYFCPAPFSAEITSRIQAAALDAFRAIGGRDYGRVDVMVRPNGDPIILEVNTLPGMTETSLLPKAAAAAGLGFPDLCQRLIELAWARRRLMTSQAL